MQGKGWILAQGFVVLLLVVFSMTAAGCDIIGEMQRMDVAKLGLLALFGFGALWTALRLLR